MPVLQPPVTEEFTVSGDRWRHRPDVMLLSVAEWRAVVEERTWPPYVTVLLDALALAADDNGELLNFRLHEFYAAEMSAVLRDGDDAAAWSLAYDRFVALVLMSTMERLLHTGYLALRDNGDSYDYRLVIPPV